MKKNKIIYWTSTGLLSAILLMSSGMYIFKNEMVREAFTSLGYPTYLIYPLVVAKISAITVLITQKDSIIKQWVYSALFFELLLAFSAHIMVGDGEQILAVVALLMLISSLIFSKKIYSNKNLSV